jgi:hypothetical protein
MCYCITKGEITMVINKWDDEWQIPFLTQESLERIAEEEEGHG